MFYKIADNGIQVLKSENNKTFVNHSPLNIIYNELDYKFCMGECGMEGCECQYHTFTETEGATTYLNDNLLSVVDYKASIEIPEEPLTNDEVMISTLATSVVNNMERTDAVEARIDVLDGGGS